MDITSNTTPTTLKRRTLGLSRGVGVNKSNTIPISPIRPIETITDSAVTSLQRKDENTATEPNEPIGRVSDSVNSRIARTTFTAKPNIARHKLSLCKDTNETMTRKRLRSQNAKSPKEPKRLKLEPNAELLSTRYEEPKSSAKIENCDNVPPSEEASEKINSESSSETLLQNEIDRMKKQITTTEKYQQQISELEALIIKWRAAGLKTIEDIQEKIHPREEVSAILAHFNIDPGLFELDAAE
ncbi:uncharacterized protein LOC119068282 [Bradysia coprophila]|uniref:uncharacterized protein LOC119068282 n=1 Tax=Bradysia coprophila TaxID=38358 RepID=UPI00187DB9D7|nr:uncharacterized protein LOC119068282 [Bradysia coprophila]XP_037027711.1 uncharacterized protein LOC119068282 [Bradysia coprophila]